MKGGEEGVNKSKDADSQSDLINSPDWSELTRECLTNIFSRLSLEDQWRRAMVVCKSWQEACKDPSLYSRFDLNPYFESSPDESVHWWSPEFERRIDSMLRSVSEWSDGSLVEIRVRHCSDRALIDSLKRSPKLEVLSIKSSHSATDSSMSALSSTCPKLKELDISDCPAISHESLLLLGRNLPSLKTLKRNFRTWYWQDGDTEACAIGKTMPNLTHLEIQFSKMTSKGLNSICDGCKELEFFDMCGRSHLTAPEIFYATSRLKKLKMLKKPINLIGF